MTVGLAEKETEWNTIRVGVGVRVGGCGWVGGRERERERERVEHNARGILDPRRSMTGTLTRHSSDACVCRKYVYETLSY
jgi:hypothetical protein